MILVVIMMVPITMTLLGILTDVNAVHDRNALPAMLVVLLAKVIEHGLVIHRLQQPVPVVLLQVTDIGQKLVVGKAFAPIVLPVGPVHETHDSDEHP